MDIFREKKVLYVISEGGKFVWRKHFFIPEVRNAIWKFVGIKTFCDLRGGHCRLEVCWEKKVFLNPRGGQCYLEIWSEKNHYDRRGGHCHLENVREKKALYGNFGNRGQSKRLPQQDDEI